jgi:hypothetical protein
MESTTGRIMGIGRAFSANVAQAVMSSASVLPGASVIGAFSVA